MTGSEDAVVTEPERRALQQQIDAIAWYHEFDFGNGLRAMSTMSDVESHRAVWAFIKAHLDDIDFAGKTVLDIGCWDGYWSFYAERRGARSVLATDDVSQNHSTGSGVMLAKRLLHSSIEVAGDVSVYEIARLNRTFDIILCMGVYYHLVDPFAAFAQVRHCCHPDTVVVFEGDATNSIRADTAFCAPKDGSGSMFVPTPYSLRQMLRMAYFDVVRQAWREKPRDPSLLRRYRYLATIAGHADGAGLPPLPKIERMITLCKPWQGVNAMHAYKPPFGLHRYDDRFR